jgi:hypothetical protein
MVIVIVNVVLSRYMTPISIVLLKNEMKQDDEGGDNDHDDDHHHHHHPEKDPQQLPTDAHDDDDDRNMWSNATLALQKKYDDFDNPHHHEQHGVVVNHDKQPPPPAAQPWRIIQEKPPRRGNVGVVGNVVVFQKYLNLNLSHELWKDIELGFLTCVNTDNPTAAQYLFRLLWRWCLLNGVVFAVLHLGLRVLLK